MESGLSTIFSKSWAHRTFPRNLWRGGEESFWRSLDEENKKVALIFQGEITQEEKNVFNLIKSDRSKVKANFSLYVGVVHSSLSCLYQSLLSYRGGPVCRSSLSGVAPPPLDGHWQRSLGAPLAPPTDQLVPVAAGFFPSFRIPKWFLRELLHNFPNIGSLILDTAASLMNA